MAVQARAQIEAYIGATGSGKGVSIARRLAELKPRRLLIWDPRAEYGKHARQVSMSEAVKIVGTSNGGPFTLRVVPDGKVALSDVFALLCKLAFRVGDMVFLAEELSDVTKASWAPPAWRQCITQGRHQGLHLIGATQRPALIDKTFLSAATVVRCFMLGYHDDCKTMGKELRVPEAAIELLATVEDETKRPTRTTIMYLERVRRTRELFAGRIVVQGHRFDEEKRTYEVGAT